MLRVYNTLTKTKEEFIPINGNKVKMFVCGPTVYDYIHIGNAKSYIGFDVVVRYLRYRGYDVFYLQNITDIEDRMIKRAGELGISVPELAAKYEKEYYEDMKTLNVSSVDKYERATDFIPQIIEQIRVLAEKGYAYEIDDGVYFDVARFEEYGKLSHKNLDDILKDQKMSRIEPNPQKVNFVDFSLWKRAKPGEPEWDSPWGKGRPGWHIEDTAISISNFGPQYDLHGGGEDLIFPHHEAEITQAESFTGKVPFVKYWLHNAFLKVEGQKMSKSLGNFITVKDAVKKHGADLIRFVFSINPYYRPMDYAEGKIHEAKEKLQKIRDTAENLQIIADSDITEGELDSGELVNETRVKFIEAMDDNFNTAEAVGAIFDYVRKVNDLIRMGNVDKEGAEKMLALFSEFQNVLGVTFVVEKQDKLKPEEEKLIREREETRALKNWMRADEIRNMLKARGIILEDGPMGTIWKREKKA